MKIIITPTGKTVLKEIELNEKRMKKAMTNSMLMHKRRQSKLWTKQKGCNNMNNITLIKKPIYIIDIGEGKVIKDKVSNIKKIALSKSKVNLTRSMHLKYGSQYETSQNDEFTNDQFSPLSPGSLGRELNQTLKLRNIFTPKAIKAMKRDFKKSEKLKEQEMRQTAHSFRSVFKPKVNRNQILDKILLKEIHPDKNDLINYLCQKEYISPLLIKAISLYDNVKIAKMNKVCQILFKNEDERRKYSQSINYKLNAKERSMKNIFTQAMMNISKDMHETKDILEKYHKKANHVSLLREFVNDIRTNYWEKFKVDKLIMNSARKSKISLLKNNNFNNEYDLMKKYIIDEYEE